MLINALDPEESRIAVVENGVLQELHVEIANREAYLGNIYKGRVVNIEPSIGAAFVNFGGSSNGFLHVSDVLPAYGQDDFTLIDLVEGRAHASGEDGPAVVRAVLEDEENGGDGADADADGDEAAESDDGEVEATEASAEVEAADAEADDADVEDVDAGDVDAEDVAEDEGEDADEDIDEVTDEEPEESDEPDAEPAIEASEEDIVAPQDDAEEDDDLIFSMAAARSGGKKKSSRRRRSTKAKAAEAGADGGDADGDGTVATAEAGTDAGSEGGDGDGDGPAPAKARRSPSKKKSSRGNGRRRGGPKRERPRAPRVPIEQLLKKGQEVVVQVTKEGIGAKGPTLTTYISLPGRSLVLMPSLPKCGVSRKIHDDKERRRLKRIVRTLDETGSGGLGFIVRTAGVGKTKEDLVRDRDYLKKIWELVAQRLQNTRAPALLYQESDLVLKAMRDLFAPDIEEVAVDSKDVFLRIKDFAEKLMPNMADRIRRHESTTPIYHSFGIEPEVQTLYQPKVELKSGISIVIDQTEALVAIDVNSGKFKPGTNLEETAYKTNMAAVPEIARQLRLRDLGGVIIIDFIDMNLEKHKRGVERKLIECLKGERARIKVGRISPFGMLELTRQRVGPGLKRTVFQTCVACSGAGLTRTVPSKALSVLRDVRAILNLKGFSILQVFVSPGVNDYLVNHKRRSLLDLEEALGKSVVMKPEPSYPVDVVHFRFLTADGQEARVVIPAGLGVQA